MMLMERDASNIDRIRSFYDPEHVRHVRLPDEAGPIQVCMDARMLMQPSGTGVATYAEMLARCLPAVGAEVLVLDDQRAAGPRSRVSRWLAAATGLARTPRASGLAAVEGPMRWRAPDIFREAQVFFNLYGRLLPLAFDRPPLVMHWTYPVPIHVLGARNLYTIHDLIPLTHPHLTPIPAGRHGAMLKRIAERADGIVTVSQTVRAAVIDQLGIDQQRVVTSYQAVDTPLQSDPPLPAGLRAGGYFLACGRVERRKNLERLALAHAASGTRRPLVVVGPAVPGEEGLEAVLRRSPNVTRIAWLPRPELIGMMRRARALLFPSLAEGFGLPIIEAMALGCPVLTSHGGAAAEVAGSAALLVDPLDDAALTEAIRCLDHQNEWCARLRAAGFRRSNAFTPDHYVRRLRRLYADALAWGPRA